MTLQILIATVNNRFSDRKYIPPSVDYLVINQLDKDMRGPKQDNFLNCGAHGLSNSRNKAIEKATADICLLSDDDTVFLNDTNKTISNAFSENPSADIITFQIKTPEGGLFKKYPGKKKWHNRLSLMQVASVEIAFKRDKVLSSGLQFDERFGLGADFPTGEENIFLIDALNKGLKILYLPVPVVIHPHESSGANMNDLRLIMAKGAMFYRMFRQTGYLLSLLFAIKKYSLSNLGFVRFYILMLQGISAYKNL